MQVLQNGYNEGSNTDLRNLMVLTKLRRKNLPVALIFVHFDFRVGFESDLVFRFRYFNDDVPVNAEEYKLLTKRIAEKGSAILCYLTKDQKGYFEIPF